MVAITQSQLWKVTIMKTTSRLFSQSQKSPSPREPKVQLAEATLKLITEAKTIAYM